ncbi:hypothetical protein OROMI_006552 [Orobanche minor]
MTPLEAEEILTYIKSPRNGFVCYFSSKLDVPSNIVQKKRVAQILFFKIRPSQEILKIRDGTPLEAEEILTYIKGPRNGSVCYFYSKLDVPSNVVQKKRVARILFFKIKPSQEILKIRDGTPLEAEEILTYIKALEMDQVARIMFFKIRPSQEILKIRDGTPLEAEEILTYIKSPRNGFVCYFSSKLDVPSNIVQKKRVAQILFFKIRPSQEILKILDGTPLEAEEILTYIKGPRNGSVSYYSSKLDVPSNAEEILTYIKSPRNGFVCYFSSKLDVPSNIVQKKRVAQILFFKIRPSQEILKIRDGTPLEAEEILTYIKGPRNGSVCYFYSKLDVPSNVVQKKRVARILFFKIKPSQEILKIRDGTPLEAEEILTYIKALEMDQVARIMFFKIRPSQEILKIRDGTPLEAEEILTYIKSPRNGFVCYFSSKLDVPSNIVQKKRVAQILFFKIRPSQEILKILDGTPLEAEEILTYIKGPRNGSVSYYSSNPRNGLWPSQEILKIRDGTPLEAEEILTYIKGPRNGSVCYFYSKLDVPSNVVQKKRVARILFFKIKPSQEILKIRDGTPLEAEEILTYIKALETDQVAQILFFKIRPSQEILKIRDGTPLEAEEILTYIKGPRNGSVCYFYSKLDVPSNVVQKKRVARILFFKIKPSQEILKIRDGTPLEAEEILTYIKALEMDQVARIMFFKIRPSQEILKIRDGTPLEAEEILTYIKSPRNGFVCYFSSKLDVPSNIVQKKRVAQILFFKIRPSQEILKILDGTPLEAEEILTYIKGPRNGSVSYYSSKLDVPSNAEEILTYIKSPRNGLWPSQEILKIRDGTPLEAEEILTYIKGPRNGSVCYFYSKLDVPSNVVQKKRVARILFFKIKPSQEILKIRDGTPLEAEEILTYIKALETDQFAEEILTYIKSPRNGFVCYFSSKLDVPSNIVQKKRVAQILFFKIRPSQEILKILDGTPLEAEEILTYIKGPRNGSVSYYSSKLDVPSNAEEILTYIKSPRNGFVCYFSSKLDVPSNIVQKKRVAQILFFKIRPSQEILKIRDGTPLEAEEILTYIKGPRNGSVCYFYSKLDVPSNVVQKKRVARILFFKIKPSQEILKIRDGTPLEAEEILTYIKALEMDQVARIMFFKIRPSQEILKIRDGTPLEAEEILTYIKSPRNGFVCYFSSKLDVPSNIVQKKRVAQILFFKIRPSQEILKILDGTPLEAEEILTYIKGPRNGSVSYYSSKLDVPSNAEEILTYIKSPRNGLWPSQEILKIRDGTPLEAEEILTYIKGPRNGSVCYFYSKLDVPSNVVQKKRVARILFFKIKPSQEILKIRDGTPLEAEEILTYIKALETDQFAEEILTYIKSPRNGFVCYFSRKLDVPSNIVQKKRVAQILFFKIRPSQEILKIRDPFGGGGNFDIHKRQSQEILKIRDGTPLEAEEILTYIKSPRNGLVCYFSSKLDFPSNVVQKKRVARILFFKIRPFQEILKIRDGTPFEAEEILTYIKTLEADQFITFLAKILKFRDGTPLEAEEIMTYIKGPRNGSVCYFSSKLDVPNNVVQNKKLDVPSNVEQKKRVARILFFKIRPSQEILKIRDGTTLEAEEILTYIKGPRNGSDFYFSRKLDVPNNVVQNKKWNGF